MSAGFYPPPIELPQQDAPVVLIVDDVPDNVAPLHDALDEAGYTVLVALDGEAALRRAAQALPDVILLDALMPGLDGFEVARRLKADPATAQIPIIFMTGLTETEHLVAALEAGGADYVTKPIKPREVMARMGVHLRTARHVRQGALERSQARNALDAFGYATITVRERDGRLMWQTPLARDLLLRYCGTEAPATPPAVLQWLRRQLPLLADAGQPPREPPRLTLENGPRRLTFRLHQRVGDQEGEAGEGGDWLIVMQETSDASVLEAIAHAFGLTAREAEVLYWVAKGKINRDIGDILGASPATVKKHLERIYAKLGVETRTAAAAMAINRVPLLQPRHGALIPGPPRDHPAARRLGRPRATAGHGASYNARMLSDESVSSSSSPLLAGLNTEQAAAVTLPAEHALILAGAGSGKTRVLTTRIAWLMQTGQVTPGGVLAVTFTNKAAKEMMTRLSAMLPINVRGMWIGTFHGLCNRFLRAHYKLADLPQTFQILDTQDQLSAVKRLCKQFNVDDERFPPKQLQYFISGCKEDGQRPRDVVARDEDTRKKVELYALYEEQCQREGVVDFGELMLRSYEVLRDNDPVREHYQRRFRHILVDEFQDTNRLQYAWLKMFSSPPMAGLPGEGGGSGNAVFAVGDDDQSIYAFRGARVGNMADFVREFNVRHQIKLEQNYRSCSNILDSANQLISHNSSRLGKNLRTDAGAGEPVRVFEATSDFAEAQWMVDEMKQLVREGMPRAEIAVLYRSNAQSRVVETALFNAGMPYRVYGGLRFFERAEIKHALAYLRLLENPHDDTSFLRVVNFPPRGIGARSIEQLQDVARASGCSLHDGVSAVTGRAGVAIGAFVAKLDVLRERSEGMTLSEIIELVLEHSGLVEHYRAEREGQERVENLEELVSAAKSFVGIEGFGRDAVARTGDGALAQSPASQGLDASLPVLDEPLAPDADTGETMSPLAAFLTHAALESGDNQAQAGQDAVQLMTVHAAKGLEFDCVFITGMEEGLFPHENSMSDRDGLEEERRLMYVAITRARGRLYLSHSQTRMLHGQTRYNLKSRFFDELPEACLKWLTPQQPAWQAGGVGGGTWQNGRRAYGSAPVLQPAWSPGFAERGDPKGLGQTAPEPDRGTDIRAGQKVFHNKFGEGKVQAIEGAGADARAQVNFSRHGVKWLALSVAKLTPVDD